ncbi:LON peptidase substrate-binding domain-containing protein [Chloroflexota bacterium]
MYELPLFPLNTVLFPGTPLNLHIFEARYKQMVKMCMDEKKPFGVALIRQGVEAAGPLAQPFPVGCTARIIQVQRLNQGRMNIVALGEERFRIHSLDSQSHPYLVGTVADYPMPAPSPPALQRFGPSLRRQVEGYIATLINAGGVKFDLEQLPTEPMPLAYMAAAILQISAARKQALLSFENADDLLSSLCDHYRREIALLQVTLTSSGSRWMPGGFSIN